LKFEFILQDENKNEICFTKTQNQYITSEIEGLEPPTATISTSKYASVDGSYLNLAIIEKRNIVVSFNMCGINIENRRHKLYDVVKPRKYIKAIYRTKKRDVYCEGVVESCSVNRFDKEITGQISIICVDPFWYSSSEQKFQLDTLIGAFHFPFSIEESGIPFSYYDTNEYVEISNEGDDTGVEIVIEFSGECKNPGIYMVDSQDYIKLNRTFQSSDTVTINTRPMHKSITLNRKGAETNIISSFENGSTWLTLKTGINRFKVSADDGMAHMHVEMKFKNVYLGV
jgi:predicted phage tail component-like protein